MFRNRNIFCLFFFLILSNGICIAQKQLNFGKTLLDTKSINLNKVNCAITPEIVLDTNKKEIVVILYTKWLDKTNKQIESINNFLYLIDDFDNWRTAIKEGGNFDITGDPSIPKQIKETKSVVVSENGEKITIEPFSNGYNEATKTSLPIKFKIAGLEENKLIIDFSFTYLKGDKVRKIEEVDQKLSWTFVLPTKKVIQNDCQTKQLVYNDRINKISEEYSQLDFINQFERPEPDITELENKFIEFKNVIVTAKKLINEIDNDVSFSSCPKIKINLIQEIKSKIKIEVNLEEIANKITEIKTHPLTKKNEDKTETEKKEVVIDKSVQKDINADLKEIVKKYERIINELSNELNTLEVTIDIKQADIETRLGNNATRIYSIQRMFSKKDQLSPDSLTQLSANLEFSNKENKDTYDENNDLLLLIRNYKTKIEGVLSICKSDFQNIDKKAFPKEGLNMQNEFNGLITQAIVIEGKLEKQQELIGGHNKILGELITKKIGNEELQLTINLFDTKFKEILDKFKNLQQEYITLDGKIENKIISRWYFKWVKENLLADIEFVKESHNGIKASFNSLIVKKDSAFRKYDFDPNIEACQEIEKAETGFDNRIETLKTKVTESVPEPFPYLYAVLSIILLSILVFGITVYYLALRKRKIKEITIKSFEKSTVSAIKLQHHEINKSLKGSGLSEYLKKSEDRFLELDLSSEWNDSAVTRIYFDRECIIKTYRFFEDSIHAAGSDVTANETGGYIIGQWDYSKEDPTKYIVSLEDFIEPGDDASFSKYQLNFGAKIGVKLQKILDNRRQKTQRDFVMTAWFHSHPGLKIFLSDYDLTVQKDFAGNHNKHRMIALVLDPYTPLWDIGIFTYKSNGEMNNAVDSKKLFSFDSMYQWALNTQSQNQMGNFFTYNLTQEFPDSIVSQVYFTNPGILEIKRFIEDAKLKSNDEVITVFLIGEKNIINSTNSYVLIDNVIRTNNTTNSQISNEDNIVGTLTCLSGITESYEGKLQHILREFEFMNEKLNIILAFNFDEDSFTIIPKIKGIGFSKLNREGKTKIFLSDLIDWTRKRK